MREGLCRAFLAREFSEKVRLFVIPALALSGVSAFTFVTQKEAKMFASDMPWMLYSYLKLGNEQAGRLCKNPYVS